MISFLNELYRRGFITREDLAGTDDTIKAKREQGSVYMFVDGPNALQYPPAGNPDVSYMAGPVFDTFLATQQGGIHWCATFITTNCDNPEAAIKLTSFLASTEGDRAEPVGHRGPGLRAGTPTARPSTPPGMTSRRPPAPPSTTTPAATSCSP